MFTVSPLTPSTPLRPGLYPLPHELYSVIASTPSIILSLRACRQAREAISEVENDAEIATPTLRQLLSVAGSTRLSSTLRLRPKGARRRQDWLAMTVVGIASTFPSVGNCHIHSPPLCPVRVVGNGQFSKGGGSLIPPFVGEESLCRHKK